MKHAIHRLLARLTLILTLFALPAAHAAPGDVDPLNAAVVGSYVLASAVQPDGKTIIGGHFTSVLGQPLNYIARLNADGTLDAGFDPNANGPVHSVAVQADGRILIGGQFITVGGTARSNIARLNADGTLDMGFNPNASSGVFSVAVQADGRILIGGLFNTVGGTARNRIARLNADGTLDASFNPSANGPVYSVAVQADGRILIGGGFTAVGGTARNHIARLNADGTLDAGFNPDASSDVNSVAVQADGRILLGGFFTAVGGTARNRIARLNADGTLDMGFNPNANNIVYSVAVQADGRILIGGSFTSVGGIARNYIARVDAAGALDADFNPNANNVVYSVAVQADGRILLGGQFTTVGGTARICFARLLNDPATQTLSAPDATQATWTRGGSSPEVSQVTFEKSTDSGATWTLLGNGTRIGTTPNWQLTGLSLPGTGQLRARGRTAGGYFNGGSGLVEATASFSFGDTTPPETTITGGPSGTVTSASATFTYSADEAATFTYSLDGGAPATGAGPVTFNGLAQGAHTFSVFATDTLGNVDATPATQVWTVDTISPETTITSGPSGTVGSNTATFAYSADEAATFTYSLDGGAPATGAGPVTFNSLPEGAHIFSVFAVDTAGNVDATPATQTWTVDTTPPTLTLPGPITAEATSAAGAVVSYTASASDSSGVASESYTPASGSAFAFGTTAVNVSATDNAGNTATGTFTVTVSDTTPPAATVPPALTIYNSAAPDLSGAVAASDAVGVASVTQTSPAAGNTLADGLHVFTFTVLDVTGLSTVAATNVTVDTTNVPPQAVDDAVTATTGDTTVYPLANDRDDEGDVLSLVSTDGPGVTIAGRALIIPAGYTGTFAYTATDGRNPTTADVIVTAGTPVAGAKKYTGLLYEGSGAIAGWVTVNHSVKNVATAQIKLGGTNGKAIIALPKTAPSSGNGTSAIGGLALDFTADNRMSATLTAGADTFTADLRPSVTSTTIARHHIALASIHTAIPGGGFATAKIKSDGSAIVVGRLPDGRPFKAGTSLGDNGAISLYCVEGKNVLPPGIVGGELITANLAATDVTGELAWSKPAQSVGAKGTHLGGVDTILTANGSLFSTPITLGGAGTLTLSGGGIPAATSTSVTITAGAFPVPAGSATKWAAKPDKGTFRAKVLVPGIAKPVGGSGLFLPKSNSAWGYFPGTTLGGRIELSVP